MKQKSWNAFFLSESILVLSVLLLLFNMLNLSFHYWKTKVDVDRFFIQFEQRLYQTQQLAILNEEKTYIEIQHSTNQIYYSWVNSSGKQSQIPKSVEVKGPTKLIFLATGNVASKIPAYEFTDNHQKKKIIFQFQLGSGRFIKKEEKL